MPSLLWWGLVAAWGAFQARRVTKPSAPSGPGEKGVAEQGTGSLCFPALPLLSRIPISVPMATTHQEAAAEIPVPPPARKRTGGWSSVTRAFLPGRSLTVSQKGNSVFHTGKKNTGPPATHHGGAPRWQQRDQDEGPGGLQKRDGSPEEQGGQPHRCAAGGGAPAAP